MTKQYYNLSTEEVLTSLKTEIGGLKNNEALKRLKHYGFNRLPKEKSFSLWLLLLRQFQSTLIYILLIAAGISFFLQDYINMYVILAAVGLNVVVGFVQESRAQRALEKLRKVVTQYATVKRDGHEVQVETEKLVLGDIVILKAGDKVPADIRLIHANDLKVNEASLTGESFPVKKVVEALPSAVIVAEQKNVVFMGTTIVTGTAEGVIIGTGVQTQLGKIATLIKSAEEEPTPLQRKLSRLGKALGVIILALSFIIFLVGVILDYDFKEMFTTAVALAVSAIPEGLVVVVTVILAIGMQRILKQQGLVRNLIAAETLGSVTIICTDKTGTLTEGKMRVSRIITHNQSLDTAKFSLKGNEDDIGQKTYFLALKLGLLASNAYIENPEAAFEELRVIGSPTEKALVLAAQQAGFNQDKVRKENPRLEEIPFDSDKKYMATLHKDRHGKKVIYFKGAPEVILDNSLKIDLDGQIENLTTARRAKVENEYKKLSREGLRMLALAYRPVSKGYESIYGDKKLFDEVIFVGFVSIKDPLRKEAVATISLCQAAGIRPVMLTGDHKLTAQSIAKELGLPASDQNVIEGEKFEQLNQKELAKKISDFSVYARINPHDKLRIVDAWQEKGEVVAMTGDGVNDAPALKAADIGVALGSGTDVAKETADIILLDNNFSTIVKAVEQGRIIYGNIKKVILYLMSDSFTEMIVIVGGLLLGWPLPLLAAQILWINLISDGFPNIALTMELGDKDIMKLKPVSSKKSIIDFEIKLLIVIISLLSGVLALGIFYWVWKSTGDLEKARTMTFAAVAVNSLLYVFSCRSLRTFIWQRRMFSNKYLLVAVILGFLLQLIAMYHPFFQNVFQTISLTISDWLIVFSVGLVDIIAIEISKWFFIHRKYQK